MLKQGDKIIFRNSNGFISKAINYFAENRTHMGIVFGEMNNKLWLIEASDTVRLFRVDLLLHPSSNNDYKVFRPIGVPESVQETVNNRLELFISKKYAILQIIDHLRYWFWTRPFVKKYIFWLPKLFGKPDDGRQWNVWFVKNLVCSELGWYDLEYTAQEMGWEDVLNKIYEWNSNLFRPVDCERVYEAFPDKFELIEQSKYFEEHK